MSSLDWTLDCSDCRASVGPDGLRTVCPDCGAPYLVRYARRVSRSPATVLTAGRGHTMWRYREFLPLAENEEPVTLGEGGTPLLKAQRLAERLGMSDLWIKDEASNPTGSFKARGLAAALTRAGASVRVYAPSSTPAPLLAQMAAYGAEVVTVDGHIGDCGKLARAHANEALAFDLSTLREPYRIEGKKTLGLEIAESSSWRLPGAVVYPTGGGTGLIGMWKIFGELIAAGWVKGPDATAVLRAGDRLCAGRESV